MDEKSKSQDPHDADPGIAPSSIYIYIFFTTFLFVCGSSAWQFPSVDVPSSEINNQIWTLPFFLVPYIMSALTNNLQRRLFDAHCHLQFHVERTKKLLEADALSSSSIQGGIGLASTRQEDWSSVAELAAANVFVKPCFGLHPWWVELESSNADILACLMNDLRDRLETNSSAIVGEIGLDRIHCDYKYRDTPRSDSPGPGPFESSTTPDFESGETRDSIKLDAKALQAQLYSSQKELLQAQWNTLLMVKKN